MRDMTLTVSLALIENQKCYFFFSEFFFCFHFLIYYYFGTLNLNLKMSLGHICALLSLWELKVTNVDESEDTKG